MQFATPPTEAPSEALGPERIPGTWTADEAVPGPSATWPFWREVLGWWVRCG